MSTPQGALLAHRYRLDEPLIPDRGNGHSLWRGTDNLLNRLVSIELRVPGGQAAADMLTSAMTTGRIGHPCVIGVYDAIDEGDRAYVVREWVEGYTLTQVLAAEGPLDSSRAAGIARAVSDALAAIHAADVAHGNLSPDTVLIGQDNDVTLIDLQLSPHHSQLADVRAVGGLLYAALTGYWPYEAGAIVTALPEAVHVDGRLCSPRQVRAGIPGYLDALTMDLLDPAVGTPDAAELAGELRRYDITDPDLGPLTAFEAAPAPQRPLWKRYGVPIVGIVCLLAVALVVLVRGLPDFGDSGYPISDDPTKKSSGPPQPIKPVAASILDPQGDGEETRNAARAIDGDATTAWKTAGYSQPAFGNQKKGMGVIVDLGKSTSIRGVKVKLSMPGATVEVRAADDNPNAVGGYRVVASAVPEAPADVEFTLDKAVTARYVLVWITKLPNSGEGKYPYIIGVEEITVQG